MTTSISNVNNALVDSRVVEALRQVLPMLSMFSLDISEDDRIVSDTTAVPLATDPTVGTKTAGTTVTAGGALTSATITYNRHRGASWDAIEGTIRPSLFSNYWADKVAGAVYGCAKDVIDYALSLITAANYGDATGDKLVVAPADFGQNDAAQLWKKAVAKIKGQNKVVMLNTDYAAELFGNSNLALVYANAGNDFLAEGKLPRFLGLNQLHYADMPANSENLGGAAIGRAAIAVGLARPGSLMNSGEGNIVERRIITDPQTGISVLYTVTADGGGTLTGEVSILYGASKGQDTVVRLLSA